MEGGRTCRSGAEKVGPLGCIVLGNREETKEREEEMAEYEGKVCDQYLGVRCMCFLSFRRKPFSLFFPPLSPTFFIRRPPLLGLSYRRFGCLLSSLRAAACVCLLAKGRGRRGRKQCVNLSQHMRFRSTPRLHGSSHQIYLRCLLFLPLSVGCDFSSDMSPCGALPGSNHMLKQFGREIE